METLAIFREEYDLRCYFCIVFYSSALAVLGDSAMTYYDN